MGRIFSGESGHRKDISQGWNTRTQDCVHFLGWGLGVKQYLTCVLALNPALLFISYLNWGK